MGQKTNPTDVGTPQYGKDLVSLITILCTHYRCDHFGWGSAGGCRGLYRENDHPPYERIPDGEVILD